MPQIPVFQESGRMEVKSPTYATNPRDAQVTGDAISAAGQGIQSIGGAVMDIGAEKRKIAREQKADYNREKYQGIALDVRAQLKREGKLDTADADFKTRFNELTSGLMDGETDPYVLGRGKADLLAVQNQFVNQLEPIATAAFIQKTQGANADSLNAKAGRVRENPEQADQAAADFEREILGAKLAYAPEKVAAIIQEGKKEIYKAEIFGYSDKGELETAKRALLEKHADLFAVSKLDTDVDGKQIKTNEQDQILNKIENENYQRLQRQNALYDRDKRINAEVAKEQRSALGSQSLAWITEAKTPEDLSFQLKRGDAMFAAGTIDREAWSAMHAAASSTKKDFNAKVELQVTDQIFSGGLSEKGARDLIMQMVTDRKLDPQAATPLLKLAHSLNIQKQHDPIFQRKMKVLKDGIDTSFGKDTLSFTMNNEDRQLKSQAYRTAMDLVNQGMDPEQALDRAVHQHAVPLKRVPVVPGVPPELNSDKKGLSQARKIVEDRLKNKDITLKQAKDAFGIIIRRQRALENEALLNQKVTQ
jgi:hypothetical protein